MNTGRLHAVWPSNDMRAGRSLREDESSDNGEDRSMSQYALRSGRRFPRYPAPTSPREEALSPQALEHGDYYAGKFGTTAAIARWHSGKRRFVFVEYALGRERVRSVPHIAESAAGERFTPLTRIEPKPASRVSDYAFETAG